jgi:hypothetical protein
MQLGKLGMRGGKEGESREIATLNNRIFLRFSSIEAPNGSLYLHIEVFKIIILSYFRG